jgi:hypothetical protein
MIACPVTTIPPAPREPYVRPGPTELVVGVYLQGGAFIPNCPPPIHGPETGTVTLTRNGVVVARQTITRSRLFAFHVRAGRYVITTPRAAPVTVRVRAGYTTRRDVFIDVS